MNKLAKDFKDIEHEFFEFDDENKKVIMKLEYDKVSDILDKNAKTKTPLLSDDFIDWTKTAMEYTPDKHRIDVDVSFKDLEGYSGEELKDIFYKNIVLEEKRNLRGVLLKNKIALSLIVIGFISLIAMILLKALWKEGGVAKEIISFIFDIATTVTFWEALTILIVENKEKRDLTKNLVKKFDNIVFYKKEE